MLRRATNDFGCVCLCVFYFAPLLFSSLLLSQEDCLFCPCHPPTSVCLPDGMAPAINFNLLGSLTIRWEPYDTSISFTSPHQPHQPPSTQSLVTSISSENSQSCKLTWFKAHSKLDLSALPEFQIDSIASHSSRLIAMWQPSNPKSLSNI